MTFQNQVSLKSHDICDHKTILHMIDGNEPLSIANAIGKESTVFPWPISSRKDLQGKKIYAGISFPLTNVRPLLALVAESPLSLWSSEWQKAVTPV